MVSFRSTFFTFILITFTLAVFTGPADAQDVIVVPPPAAATAAPPTATRTGIGYVGTSYNPQGSPKAALNLGGFYPVMDDDRLYVGAAVDVNWKPNSQPKVAIRPEALPRLYTFEINGVSIPVYGIVGIGAQIEPTDPVATIANLRAALSNVGTNYGLSAAIGITTSVRIAKALYISPSFRWIGGDGKPAKIAGIGLTYKFTVKVKPASPPVAVPGLLRN